ncbi:hypothetical protein JCM10207_007589 [Rhodosporidiobolus poonsookiae]
MPSLPITPPRRFLPLPSTHPSTCGTSSALPPAARRSTVRRLLLLGLFTLVALTLFLLAPASFSLPDSLSPSSWTPSALFDAAPVSPPTPAPFCSARDFSSGRWVPKSPSLTPNTSVVDVLSASGFSGVTQEDFKPHWFLGSKEGDWRNMEEYRWRAAQWDWEAGSEVCGEQVRRVEAEELVRELVHGGGWMLLGDSLSEQHFFSLGCTLFPHVEVRWGAGWWEQLMFLRADSPLLDSLDLPPSFSLSSTPLITNLRTDHGYTKPELLLLFLSTPAAASTPRKKILTDYPVNSPPIDEYLSRFFSVGEYTDSPERYSTLIFSTGAHFTPREFAFPRGQPAIQDFFGAVVANWTATAREYLEREDGQGADEGDGTRRQILVRAASSGHDECHEAVSPFEDEWPRPKSYNWAVIPEMNAMFESEIDRAAHPRLNFLPLDRLSQLRPDGHSSDCLHIAVGTGIFEGWTDYLAYFVRPKARDREEGK